MSRGRIKPPQQSGFTLLEVMIAVGVMALVAAGAYLAIHAAATSSEVTRQALERFERVDRTWALMESDLRNAIGRLTHLGYGPPLPALMVDFSGEHRLTFLRGGRANPLQLPRTELVRIGYRLEDGVIWRDSWRDPTQVELRDAAQQKLVDGVNELEVRLLPLEAKSVEQGPWVDNWPGDMPPMALPVAVEITITLEDLGEVKRLFEVLPGGGGVPGARVSPGAQQGTQGTGGTQSGNGGAPGA